MAFNLSAYLRQRARLVESALDARMPAAATRPAALHKAMRYSVFAGGKRLRPIVCLAACEAAGADPAAALLPAIALEVLHTYTLIHDDLPSMDDDALRRGKPACHIVFGEATAILAGDALLTLAFEWLAPIQAPSPYPPNQLVLELAVASGSRGVVGGQSADLSAEGQPPSARRIDFIHRHKTAALLRAAARMGGIVAGAPAPVLSALSRYGEQMGLAFQIADDILNETSSARALGKAAGSDRRRKKMTTVAWRGLAAARRQAAGLARGAAQSVRTLPGRTAPLAALAEFMICRRR